MVQRVALVFRMFLGLGDLKKATQEIAKDVSKSYQHDNIACNGFYNPLQAYAYSK